MRDSLRSHRRLMAAPGPGGLVPADVAALYHLDAFYGRGLYGQGETIAFVEFASPAAADDAAFWSRWSLRPELNTTADSVLLSGPGNAPGDLGETDLDLQYAGALAPGASLRAYVIDPATPLAAFPAALLGAIGAAADAGASIVSISLGAGDLDIAAAGPLVRPGGGTWSDAASMAADIDAWAASAGVLCFVSSGDSGAYAAFPNDGRAQASWPAAQAAFVAVGGTQLAVPGSPGSGEQAWGGQTRDPSGPGYDPGNTLPRASGGGGMAAFVAAPARQSALAAPRRLLPDIAAFAGPLLVVDQGQVIPVWGTSAAAPITAAIAALYHQATGRLLDPSVLYAGARDVTRGNNYNSALLQAGLPDFSTAGPGFDLCTGMGAPDAAGLPGL